VREASDTATFAKLQCASNHDPKVLAPFSNAGDIAYLASHLTPSSLASDEDVLATLLYISILAHTTT
jgi:hypothetical protein